MRRRVHVSERKKDTEAVAMTDRPAKVKGGIFASIIGREDSILEKKDDELEKTVAEKVRSSIQ